MKKYLLLLFFSVSISMNNNGFSQDTLKTTTGEEIKANVLKITRKEAAYKVYDDPEFTTYTIPYKEIKRIKKGNQKNEIWFNHRLPRSFISLSGGSEGSSIPLGNLARTEYDNTGSDPGFALKGMNLKFEAAVYIYKKLGIDVCIGTYRNRFDYNAYADLFRGSNNSSASAYSQMNSATSSNKNKENLELWTFNHFLIGPVYSFKMGKRFTWDFKARAGLINTIRPQVVLEINEISYSSGSNYSNYYIFRETKKVDLSYNFGSSLRFLMSKRLALILSGDYINTSPLMNITIENSNKSGSNSTTLQYNFSSINYSLGLAYHFKRKGNKYE